MKELQKNLGKNEIRIAHNGDVLATIDYGVSINEIIKAESAMQQQEKDFTQLAQICGMADKDTDVVPSLQFLQQDVFQSISVADFEKDRVNPRGLAAVYHSMLEEISKRLKVMKEREEEYRKVLYFCKDALRKISHEKEILKKENQGLKNSLEQEQIDHAIKLSESEENLQTVGSPKAMRSLSQKISLLLIVNGLMIVLFFSFLLYFFLK